MGSGRVRALLQKMEKILLISGWFCFVAVFGGEISNKCAFFHGSWLDHLEITQ